MGIKIEILEHIYHPKSIIIPFDTIVMKVRCRLFARVTLPLLKDRDAKISVKTWFI